MSTVRPSGDRLSLTQLIASVLAAISATVAASYFGVAGTVIGAALGSAISVIGSAVYKRSLEHTRDRLRTVTVESAVAQRFGRPDSGSADIGPSAARSSAGPPAIGRGRLRFTRLAASGALFFAIALGLVTGFELISGKPVAATITGRGGSGTSLTGGQVSSQPSTQVPSTAAPASAAGSSSATPTATVTVTQTPSDTPTPTTSAPSTAGSSAPGSGSSASTAPSADATAPGTVAVPTATASG
jgi:hypothetical protein